MNTSQNLEQLVTISGVMAVYSYQLPHATIPLLVVTKKCHRQDLRDGHDWSEGVIVLTKKDIEDGQDVFALRFLHMQEHATHIAGKDVLKKMKIQQSKARLALESMLRVMLIDTRELLLKDQVSQDMLDMLALNIDRMGSYSSLLKGKQKARERHVKTCLTLCRTSDGDSDDLSLIYHTLEKMTKQVDAL